VPRLTPIYRPQDAPSPEVGELFTALFPGNPNAEIDRDHTGLAIAAYNPQLALRLSQMSLFLIRDTEWGQRAALRELAFAALNRHFGSTFSIEARRPHAHAAGLSDDQLAAVEQWQTSPLFDEEQKLVIEYASAVVAGAVPQPLFARVVERYGAKQAVEFTTIVGFWSAWAMLLQAAAPNL
jgi:alkylhydroperoxidase family enzyme